MANRTAFLKLARDRFKQAQDAEKDQRERELSDLRFYAGDQWPDDVKTLRKGQNAQNGLPPVPARPCLTINKTREPVRQVLNQERQSDMGIEIVPADDFGEIVGPIDETEIQLREGLVRRIQRASEAADARTWAFARSVIAGRGFYGVMTRFAPGKTNDQEIYVQRYYNQSCVTLDPAHEQPDGSDAEWGFVGNDIPWDQYVAEFGKRNGQKNALLDADDSDFRAKGDERPGWFTAEGTTDDGVVKTKMVRVVDYWYTVRKARELITFALATDPQQQRVEWADEVEGKDANPDLVALLADYVEVKDSRRTVVEKQIKWAKIDGCDDDVLDETDWPGPDMPIVKVLGEELQPYDAERRVEGMVRPMREPGQGFNYMVSRWVEMIGLSPLTPLQTPVEAIEGYENWYAVLNTRTLPYLPYNQWTEDGKQIEMPHDAPSRNPPIEAVAGSVQLFDQAIQSTSGYHKSALGQADPSVRSKRQTQQLVEQSQQGSNHFLDNLQRSIRYEGQIINNLLYPIYGRPGRIARILNKEGDAEHVLLHQPMIMQQGRPMPAPEGAADAKTYTLTKDAQFNVAIKISKNYDTKREQEVAIIGELLSANPELMTWFGDLFFQNQDGPGHQQMADRAKVMLAAPIQQMLTAKQQGQDPQAAAALAQKDAQIQQLQAELQKAAKPTAVEELKQAGEDRRTHLELLANREKMHADNETKIAVAELGAKVDRLALFLEERARLGVQQEAEADRGHEVGMAAMTQSAQAQEAERARQAAAEEAEATRQASAGESEAARQHEAEMAARAAEQQGGQA